MTIISKLRPVFRTGPVTNFLPVITQSYKIKYDRYFSTERRQNNLTKSEDRSEISTDVRPLGEKIKETTKTVSYTGVILAGISVTGIIFYVVLRELFSRNSANSIYSTALEKCKSDPRVEDALGAPIKGYGEETTRRRRTHISHAIYEKEGVKHMRMRFHIKGIRNKALVELDAKQNNYGNYECRYLLVQLDDFSGRTFIVEDNRAELDNKMELSNLPVLTLTQ